MNGTDRAIYVDSLFSFYFVPLTSLIYNGYNAFKCTKRNEQFTINQRGISPNPHGRVGWINNANFIQSAMKRFQFTINNYNS